MSDAIISTALAERLGMTTFDLNSEPTTPLDWALEWASRGIHVFPCKRFLGPPLVDRWHRAASTDASTITEWWTNWPTADIAGVPDRSGHFVLLAIADQGGITPLLDLEDEYGGLSEDFRYENLWNDEHMWIKGSAVTSHGKLGRGLHVLGRGHFVYLPASWAPCRSYNKEVI